MKRLKRWLLLTVLCCGAAAGGLAWYAHTPLTLPAPQLQITLEEGTTLKALATQLRKQGVVQSAWLFTLLGRLTGQASQLRAGSYLLDRPLSPWQLYAMIREGKGLQSSVRFIDGWNLAEVRAALNSAPDLRHDTVAMSNAQLAAALGIREPTPEGMFFPDTYFYAPGSSDLDVLRRAYALEEQKLAAAWAARAPGLPYQSSYQALIMASLIEKETAQADERPLIAAVFLNRLRLNMKLQTDPTVIYGLGSRYDGNLTRADLEIDTPYNTYTRYGLPPTPIALAGEAALLAALHPAHSAALYFVARGDGTHQFSDTLAEQNAAVYRYQIRPGGS